jgi:hypothetical protein
MHSNAEKSVNNTASQLHLGHELFVGLLFSFLFNMGDTGSIIIIIITIFVSAGLNPERPSRNHQMEIVQSRSNLSQDVRSEP